MIVLGALCSVFLAIGAWVGARTNYFPSLNDFWPLLFQSNMLSLADLDSLKNGFFPPGYAIFLRVLGGETVLARAFWTNLIFTVGTILATYGITRLFASAPAAILGAALTACHPLVFSLALTTGPDAGCAFLAASGFFLILAGARSARQTMRSVRWFIAGVLFGIAALWRYHGLVFGVAAVASGFLSYRDWRVLWAAAGPIAALLIFASLSLFPGLSPQLAHAQAFNVWKAVHPVNWYHMPADFPPSIVDVIRAEPAAFWKVYWAFNQSVLWVMAAPLLGAIALPAAIRRVPQAGLLLMLLYLPIVNLGMSLRGLAPVVPISMVCIALLVDHISRQYPTRIARVTLAVAGAATLFFVGASWFSANRAFVETARAGYEWRRGVELELRAQGVKSPLQVFGDAGFHFVTEPGPGWYAYMPHSNGGWPRLDLYGLDRVLPELTTSSLDAFIADCERRGITHLVLSGTAGYLLPELGEIYDGRRLDPRLEKTSTIAGMMIFRLIGS